VAADRGANGQGTGERVAGKYELGRLLGTGAMGAVYEGVHLELGKRMAVKVIRPEFCNSPEVVARFRREARAASLIESEHVAQIIDFGRDPALGLYMVIEYLDGEDLDARLARDRWMDRIEAATVGWQVARGLARAHAVGVVHRDLKPANIFLTRRDDGSMLAKILDFGISKHNAGIGSCGPAADGGAEPNLTERGTTVGTPQYMSPEQCQAKTELDGRTDVWSLCAVLYEALAGEPAFAGGAGHVQVMQRIVTADVPPLARRAPWVPEPLTRVIHAGLVRDRDARIGSAAELAERLLAACPEAETRTAVATSVAAPARPQPPHTPAGAAAATATPAEPAEPHAPPLSAPPPSSGEDCVEVFLRAGDLPVPVAKARR